MTRMWQHAGHDHGFAAQIPENHIHLDGVLTVVTTGQAHA